MLKEEMGNGRVNLRNESQPKPVVTKIARQETLAVMPSFFKSKLKNEESVEFPTSFCEQFSILLKRKLVQQIRNSVSHVIDACAIYLP